MLLGLNLLVGKTFAERDEKWNVDELTIQKTVALLYCALFPWQRLKED